MSRRRLIALDSYANETYGRSISSAVAGGICVRCGKAARRFADEDAAHEYAWSGLCDRCQRFDASLGGVLVPFRADADQSS